MASLKMANFMDSQDAFMTDYTNFPFLEELTMEDSWDYTDAMKLDNTKKDKNKVNFTISIKINHFFIQLIIEMTRLL